MRLLERLLPAAAAVALAASVAGCNPSAPTASKPPIPEVTVAQPVARSVTDYFEFPGQMAPIGEVEVRARVTGYIVKVNFEDGQEVKQGDLLFEIDPRPYQAALDRAKGDLARLQATLVKAKVDLARSERLRPSGAISEDEYEQHVAQLAMANASIQSAEAAVRDAALNLEFTRVVAPINGKVSNARIREGNLVQPSPGDATVLTTVVTTAPIYVYFNIDERTLLHYERMAWGSPQRVRPKRIKELKIPVEIGLCTEDGFPHMAILDFLDNQVDQETGTIRARAVFANPGQLLSPGLFVRVRVPFGKPHDALLVTERAIGTDQKQKFLLTVDKNQVVQRREITVGAKRDGLRVIQSGLQSGDWVIVKGLQRVRPGDAVKTHSEATVTQAAGGNAIDRKLDRVTDSRDVR